MLFCDVQITVLVHWIHNRCRTQQLSTQHVILQYTSHNTVKLYTKLATLNRTLTTSLGYKTILSIL